MKNPTFKVGDKVTFLGHEDLPNGGYEFSGFDQKGIIGTVSSIGYYLDRYSCYKIDVDFINTDNYSDCYAMLESEFEEYSKKANPLPKKWCTDNTLLIRKVLKKYYNSDGNMISDFESYGHRQEYNYICCDEDGIRVYSTCFSHCKYLTNDEIISLLDPEQKISSITKTWKDLPEGWYTDSNSEINEILLEAFETHKNIETSKKDLGKYKNQYNYIGYTDTSYLQLYSRSRFEDEECKYLTNAEILLLLNKQKTDENSDIIGETNNNDVSVVNEPSSNLDDFSPVINITKASNKVTKFFNY